LQEINERPTSSPFPYQEKGKNQERLQKDFQGINSSKEEVGG
jgi:hypothetical protein